MPYNSFDLASVVSLDFHRLDACGQWNRRDLGQNFVFLRLWRLFCFLGDLIGEGGRKGDGGPCNGDSSTPKRVLIVF